MIETMKETIKREALFSRGAHLVIGLSGGPDSLAMTHALLSLRGEWNLDLVAVHLNHRIRGEYADGDQRFVEAFCEEQGIRLHVFSEDIPALARRRRLSEEEAGRERRYALFEAVRIEEEADRIVVAQNRDDQVETFLMRMIRGAALDGLSSIPYQRDGVIVRPLIDCSRASIEQYCEENGLTPRIDHTNLETAYFRNRVRLALIPELEAHYNPKLKETLARNIQLIRRDAAFLDDQAETILRDLTTDEIPLKVFEGLHPAVSSRLLRKLVARANGHLKDVGSHQIEQLLRLIAEKRTGRKTCIGRSCFLIEAEALVIASEEENHPKPFNQILSEGTQVLELGGRDVSITLTRVPGNTRPDHDEWTCYLDLDKLKGPIRVRSRMAGDRFIPLGMGEKSKKLKDFMIDEKIPARKRDNVMIFTDTAMILWVAGYRMSDVCRVTPQTREMLRIELAFVASTRHV